MKYALIPLALMAGSAFACPGGSKMDAAAPSASDNSVAAAKPAAAHKKVVAMHSPPRATAGNVVAKPVDASKRVATAKAVADAPRLQSGVTAL